MPEEDGVPVLRRVVVRHHLRLGDEAQVAAADRAHAVHTRACAVHRSIGDALEIATTLEINDDPDARGADGTPT